MDLDKLTLKFLTPFGLRLDFLPLVKTLADLYGHEILDSRFVLCHWQGQPRPAHYSRDLRNFGWFQWTPEHAFYRTIAAQNWIRSESVQCVPLQISTPTLPSAVLVYFDCEIKNDGTFFYLSGGSCGYLQCVSSFSPNTSDSNNLEERGGQGF